MLEVLKKAHHLETCAFWTSAMSEELHIPGEVFYDTTSGCFKSRQVTLNFCSSKSQCKKYCLIFGFFFNSLAELYKIPVWFSFLGRAPHLYNPQSHCLSVAVPFCNSCFRDTMCFKEFKEGRTQLPCNISTGKSNWGVDGKCITDRWNLFFISCLYIDQNQKNYYIYTDSTQDRLKLPDCNILSLRPSWPFGRIHPLFWCSVYPLGLALTIHERLAIGSHFRVWYDLF